MAADLNYVQNFSYDLEEEIKQVDQKCNYALQEIEDLKGTTSSLSKMDNVLMIMSSVSLGYERKKHMERYKNCFYKKKRICSYYDY